MDQTSTLPTFYTAPSQIPGGFRGVTPGSGAISGGLLRPGAIDQPQFKAMLQAAQAANQSPIPQVDQTGVIDGIPTLTAAQFAVLTGGQAVPDAAAPKTEQTVEPMAEPARPPTLVSGKPASGELPAAAAALQPETERKVEAEFQATTQATTQATAEESTQASAKDDPRVVHFKRMPDKDERKALSAAGKRWMVDETPGSRKLFFGDDEVFGWDDFADLVNPLQHIPGVAQIYRAVTGDEINGAAELLGALPFGPTSFISSVADLAVREASGKDMGSNVIAMLFGSDDVSADEGLAAAGDKTGPADANPMAANPVAAKQIAINPRAGGRIFDRENGGHDT